MSLLSCLSRLLPRSGLLELRIKNSLGSGVQNSHTVSKLWGTSSIRFCKARPSKFGPIKIEQLTIVRKVEQKNHADYALIKAVAEKAIQAIYGSKNDVCMSDGSGFRILESEEEV